jgi:hypothetical protein
MQPLSAIIDQYGKTAQYLTTAEISKSIAIYQRMIQTKGGQ